MRAHDHPLLVPVRLQNLHHPEDVDERVVVRLQKRDKETLWCEKRTNKALCCFRFEVNLSSFFGFVRTGAKARQKCGNKQSNEN